MRNLQQSKLDPFLSHPKTETQAVSGLATPNSPILASCWDFMLPFYVNIPARKLDSNRIGQERSRIMTKKSPGPNRKRIRDLSPRVRRFFRHNSTLRLLTFSHVPSLKSTYLPKSILFHFVHSFYKLQNRILIRSLKVSHIIFLWKQNFFFSYSRAF